MWTIWIERNNLTFNNNRWDANKTKQMIWQVSLSILELHGTSLTKKLGIESSSENASWLVENWLWWWDFWLDGISLNGGGVTKAFQFSIRVPRNTCLIVSSPNVDINTRFHCPLVNSTDPNRSKPQAIHSAIKFLRCSLYLQYHYKPTLEST